MGLAPKATFPVILPEGTPGRAVRLSARNNITCLNWIPGAVYREQISKKGQISNQRLMVPVLKSKVVKAAYYDDWIVKTKDGFNVVKFDKSEEKLFFVDPDASDNEGGLALYQWQQSLKKKAKK